MADVRVWKRHACRNRACQLYRAQAPGATPGICPRCGWVRALAAITTQRVR